MAVADMNAVRAHHRGGPEQLVYEMAPRPEPRPGEALVRVRAASITADELTWAETWAVGPEPDARDRTPIIPSHELSGVVNELGAGTVEVRVHDEVYGLIPFNTDGAAAEFVTVPADVLAAKPATIDHDAAAAIPLAALTAWQALVDHARLREGQHLLLHGAAGGVGVFAVQLAAHLGATVTATARGSDRDFVKELGARDVLDYRHQVFEDHVKDVDVVLDLVGGDTQSRSWQVLRPGGTMVSIVAPPRQDQAEAGGKRGIFFIVKPDRAQLESIARLVDSGHLTPVVDRVMPLVDTRAAYEELERGHRRGKVVLHVAD
jgi:NADPH:quinone reductase-like Zn-dependent oxidoreductase